MKRLKRHVIRLRVRLAGMGAGARFAAGLLSAVILGGAVWLIWAIASPDPTVVIAGELDREARDKAAIALTRSGVKFSRTDRGLSVSRNSLPQAQKALRSDGLASKPSGSGLLRIANSSSIWSYGSDNRRRWQAEVMAELGRLITEMDPVDSASVLFDPGAPGGLGSSRKAARAAVKVNLVRGRRMSASLVVAIGELVSGSIAVEITDVRVIDQTGRSYRPSPDVQSLARRHVIEAHYSEKLISGMRYISGITADVQLVGPWNGLNQTSGGQALRVWISVPKSYVSSSGAEESLAQQLAGIKDAARAILGPTGRHEVTVTLQKGTGPAVASSATSSGRQGDMTGILAGATILVAVCGLGTVLLLHRRRPRRSSNPPVRQESSDELGYDMLESFSDDSSDDLGGDLAHEHPQTLALILVRMPSAQAANIISRLPADLRAEVARRMGDLGDVDAEVVAEINRDLARRSKAPRHRAGQRRPFTGRSQDRRVHGRQSQADRRCVGFADSLPGAR